MLWRSVVVTLVWPSTSCTTRMCTPCSISNVAAVCLASWTLASQTFREGAENIATQQIEIKQEGDRLQVVTITRGLSAEEGGYHWSGELRLWDNEVLMGWYAANDGSIRSKGTMYFVLHPHGLNMSGRWTGLGWDGRIMTGFAAMGQTQEESEAAMRKLISSEGVPYLDE